MDVITTQLIDTYYERYRDTEIMFSKEINKTLNLVPRQIYIKCGGDQWPCIVNSTSFSFARIIIGTKGGAFKKITSDKNENVSLRFCFAPLEGDVVSFFVNSHVTEISKFNGNQDLAILTLSFTQRPPTALIERIGRIHEANKNANRRKEERIILSEQVLRKLQLNLPKTELFIEKVPRKCILRNISFSGAKIIIVGLAKFLENKNINLKFYFEDPDEEITLFGKVVTIAPIESRRELVTVSVYFGDVPLSYKLRLSHYFSSIHKNKNDKETQFADTLQDDVPKGTDSVEKSESDKANTTSPNTNTDIVKQPEADSKIVSQETPTHKE